MSAVLSDEERVAFGKRVAAEFRRLADDPSAAAAYLAEMERTHVRDGLDD